MSSDEDASSISTNPLEMALARQKMRARAEEWHRTCPVDPWLQAIADETNRRYLLQRKLKRAGIGEVDPHYGRAERYGAWYSKRIEQKQARRKTMEQVDHWLNTTSQSSSSSASPQPKKPESRRRKKWNIRRTKGR